jgi:polysaccharide biosynthesis protein PslH
MSVSGPRILVVNAQRPFPPFHGSNADTWRILRSLKFHGFKINLVSWRDTLTKGDVPSELLECVETYDEFDLVANPTFRSALSPSFSRLRSLDHDTTLALVQKMYGCQAVLCIGLYGARVAKLVAQSLEIPFLYRSHAVETEYHATYLKLAAQQRRPVLTRLRDELQIRKISGFETLVYSRADKVFEISDDDLRGRVRVDDGRVSHFPPLADGWTTDLPPKPFANRQFDFGYLGNLFMPNNLSGLSWFLDRVLPVLRCVKPDLKCIVAGKVSGHDLTQRLRESGVSFLPDPASADAVYQNIRVAVNPIFHGNGTTIKTIDQLWAGCHVVSTPIGIQGYGDLTEQFPIWTATSEGAFAVSCIDALKATSASTRSLLSGYAMDSENILVKDLFSRLKPDSLLEPTESLST